MNRRNALCGCVSAVFSSFPVYEVLSAPKSRGCRLRAAQGSPSAPQLVAGSGIGAVDLAVAKEYNIIGEIFNLKATLAFFDDAASPNALATSEIYDAEKPDGTVLLGKNLSKLLATGDRSGGLLPIVGVMAHEWAHLAQFKSKKTFDWGVYEELSADYMAGWYLARTRSRDLIETHVSSVFSSLGGYEFSDPNFHGTPKQRSNTLLYGAGLVGQGDVETPPPVPSSAQEALRRSWK